jgi:phosphatidylserine/phosphatidylglycerophosphate/cardiolipin synthase-like enzyme
MYRDSQLFDETTFYPAFIDDLSHSSKEIVIESPYITSKRMSMLMPSIQRAVNKGTAVYVLTRDPREHTNMMVDESEAIIEQFEVMGVHVFLCIGNDHRKLAIIDRDILWEGSLNILSQTASREIMRRIVGRSSVQELLDFLRLDMYLRRFS